MEILLKKFHNAKKTEREEDPSRFFKIHSVAKLQRNEGGPFGDLKKNEKKVAQCEKSTGGLFGPGRYCMLRGKPFWFSSLCNRYNLTSSQNFVELLVEFFW